MTSEEIDRRRSLVLAEIGRASGSESWAFSSVPGLAAVAVASGFVLINPQIAGESLLGRVGVHGQLPDWAFFLVGVLPILFVGLYAQQLSQSVLLHYYLRDLERAYPVAPVEAGESPVGTRPLYSTIVSSINGRHGALRSQSKLLFTLGFAAAFAGFIISIAAMFRMSSPLWTVIYAFVDVAVITLSTKALFSSVFRGRKAYSRLVAYASREIRTSIAPEALDLTRPRSLGAYILTPRPADFLLKAIGFHVPAALFGLGIAISSGEPPSYAAFISRLALLIVGYEFLLYQVRYVINDWMGRHEDPRSVFAVARGRADLASLDDPERVARRVIFVVAILGRLILGIAPMAFLAREWWVYGGLIVITVVSTVVYELARRRLARRPWRSGRLWDPWIAVLLVCVQVGYGARAWAGVELGSGFAAQPKVVATAAVAGFAIGLAGVVIFWTLYGLTYTKINGSTGSVVAHPMMANHKHYIWLAWKATALDRPRAGRAKAPKNPRYTLAASTVRAQARHQLLSNAKLGASLWLGRWVAIGAAMVAGLAGGVAFVTSFFGTGDSTLWRASFLLAVGVVGACVGALALTRAAPLALLAPLLVALGWGAGSGGGASLLLVPLFIAAVTTAGTYTLTYANQVELDRVVRELVAEAWAAVLKVQHELRV